MIVIGAIFVALGFILPLILKFKKRTIQVYENKLSIYEDDVRKKDLKFNKLKSFNFRNINDNELSFDLLVIQKNSGKEMTFVLDPAINKEDLKHFLKQRIVEFKSV